MPNSKPPGQIGYDALSAPWVKTALFLQTAEATQSWQGEADSFTQWVAQQAKRKGISESSLWRFLSAFRNYKSLTRTLHEHGLIVPQIEQLPANVSPEGLELLEKLQRAMPSGAFLALADTFFSGRVTRETLRSHWKAYRKHLHGETARGKGVEKPIIPDSQRAYLKELIYEPLHFILKHGVECGALELLDGRSACYYRSFFSVRPETIHGPANIEIDAVCVIRESPATELLFHAIVFADVHKDMTTAQLKDYFDFCRRVLMQISSLAHYSWLAVPAYAAEVAERTFPDTFGLFVLWGEDNIDRPRKAKRANPTDRNCAHLAKGLLLAR